MERQTAYFTYTVQTERSIGELAQSCSTTTEVVRSINQLQSNMLHKGMRVFLPYMECAGGFFYKLRQGQTLYSIALSTGVRLEDIVAANPGIAQDACIPGQVIVLPMHLQRAKPKLMYLRIRRGDTLMRVLARSGLSIAMLQTLNPGIPLNQLYIGQQIKVIDFKKVEAPGKYVLMQGDSLSMVAQHFGTTVQAIRQANPAMQPQAYRPGVAIQLPVYTI